MCNTGFGLLDLAFVKCSLLGGSEVKIHESGSSYLVWIFSLRRDFSTEVRKSILPSEVITSSASQCLCALERKCVQGSRRESIRKHLGAFLRCLRGDIVQPGRKHVEETEVRHKSGGLSRSPEETATFRGSSRKHVSARWSSREQACSGTVANLHR